MASLSTIFQKSHVELSLLSKKSKSWFESQAAFMSQSRSYPSALFRNDRGTFVMDILPGQMLFFKYDPKHKATLPYYDAFPLVLPFRKLPDGFIGLNLHYLPYAYRAKLLDKLLEYKSNTRLDEFTRLKFSWATIEGTSRLAAAEPCVKRYLSSHVQSPFRKVDAYDWATAILLPVHSFKGATEATVWADSIRRVNK